MIHELDTWIVEDNRTLREALRDTVRETPGMQCGLAVATCEACLAALADEQLPDVILMDIGLPGLSGIDGVVRIKSEVPAIKIVILTIHDEDDKVFEAICAGADGYLLKPSPPSKVVEAIREVDHGRAPINAYVAKKMLSLFARLGPPPLSSGGYSLSDRERQILQLLVDGLTMKQIGQEIHISYHTVSNHLRNIYAKLHVRSRSSAVAKALKEELI
ncbi:MAG: DNA-binding response regulator [Deltaproteobacteria bacterium]|nr:MAG: DNA-binding response regulator [Deltaproteobacteria bacterium]